MSISNNLIELISSQESNKELITFINSKDCNKIELDGLFGSSKSYFFANSVGKGIHFFVLSNKEEAQFLCNDLYSLLGDEKVFFFPTSVAQLSKISTIKESTQKVQRSATISALNTFLERDSLSDFLVVVTYPAAIWEGVLNSKTLKSNILKISEGDMLTHEFIKETLIAYNFNRCDFVSEPGQFALRGGIIDLFSYSCDKPYRLDFFGNEVESIREFDINSQRSISNLKSIEIFPNIYDTEVFKSEESVNIFKYLENSNLSVWVDDYDFLHDQLEVMSRVEAGNESSKSYEEKDNLSGSKEKILAVKYKEILEDLLKNKTIFLSSSSYFTEIKKVEFNTAPQPAFNKNFNLLMNNLNDKISLGYKVFISSDNPKQFERLRSIFANNREVKIVPEFSELRYTIHSGFVDNIAKVCLYTDHQIFDRYHRVKIKREVATSERLTLNELNAFNIGDYIVHIDHGVGVFGGLVKTNINGKVQEAVKLIYKDNDVIFVSIHSLHRISRYKSKESAAPKIYKLGTGAWEKLKSQTKKRVKDIAKDLIKLYAERRQAKGFAFSGDTYMQHELEASFLYEDTPDQLKTTQAVKEDMEKPYPMDRLVCGDVGFGKTEIAIRAAFKAVADSKQVAVLVPTTILALQHYKTFTGRLKDLPCNVAYISRLKTTKEIKAIAADLKSGKIDIIIGTHRILNKEIQFKDLGLMIIDEEQKFGVAAKEKLKQFKLSVDSLTLTATPIPRTLQFSLLGARDLSIINTPPPNRLPVQTEIIDFNEEYIRDIIQFEIERGGQVYFVHNRVEDIMAVEDIIKRICPGVKTCVGHGQMDPKELEGKILDFIAGDYDVLVATTIVESGIDVPNANTMIINKAQNFGLSDLHQLRGRVGRSNQKAFCYLIVPPMVSVSDDARRRLRAIEAFSDLGSGFNIAMQDLDIRGAGNLLGGEQSGFVADMGFETYQKILSEAFMEIKHEEGMLSEAQEQQLKRELKKESKLQISNLDNSQKNRDNFTDAIENAPLFEQYITDCYIDTDLELLIPDKYISNTSEKIRLYKELDALSKESDLIKFTEELKDRFGELPYELEQLTYIVRLRWEAVKLGFERIIIKNGIVLAYFVNNQQSPYYRSELFSKILSYLNSGRGEYRVKEQNNKLLLRIENIKSIDKLYDILVKMRFTLEN